MTLTRPVRPQDSLKDIVQTWKDQIICLSPKGEGYSAYITDSNNNIINYIHATCDELRHSATNYDRLLIKIKEKHEGYLKEAVLNTIKYETTRRAFKKQHEWIQNNYKSTIEQKQLNAEHQVIEIAKLKQIISDQQQEIAQIKSECRGQLVAIQAESLLKQKEREIKQKNLEIAKLNQQLQASDREIDNLKLEFNNSLNQLKFKYKWLLSQFIKERNEKQRLDQKNKSLQTCQNLFIKAQRRIHLLQRENQFLKQENVALHSKTKMLNVE